MDRLARKVAHGAFDPRHERPVSRLQRRLHRLETIQIGRQGQFLRAIAGLIAGRTLRELGPRDAEAAHGWWRGRFGVSTQIGDHLRRRGLAKVRRQGRGAGLGEGLQVCEASTRLRVGLKTLAIAGRRIIEREPTDIEGQGPAVVSR